MTRQGKLFISNEIKENPVLNALEGGICYAYAGKGIIGDD